MDLKYDITAVIPVRLGSTRCKNKNIRQFGNTNLLEKKINILKKIKKISKILVSSNCDEMLKLAKDMGVDTFKRDEKYCTENCSGSDVFTELAKEVSTKYILYTHCVTPFVKLEDYNKTIDIFFEKKDISKSLITVKDLKEFIWDDDKPINYKLDNAPPSQYLPNYYVPNFGIVLVEKELVFKYRNIIIPPTEMYKLDYINSIDIDLPYEFIQSELFYINNIHNENDASNILKYREKNIELLDCTIRDGGYLNNWDYSYQQVIDCYKSVSKSNYDYFEIGFKCDKSLKPNKGLWYYSREEDINKVYNKYKGCKISVLLKLGEYDVSNIPLRINSKVSLYRIVMDRNCDFSNEEYIFYSEKQIKECKRIINILLDKGYEVTLNIGCCDIITDKEIYTICKYFNNVKLKAIYLADTYGSFDSNSLSKQLHKFYSNLETYNNSKIKFGFHIHNNNENSIDKLETALFHGITLIDTTIGGLGRGGGNLKTEQLICNFTKKKYMKIEDLIPILEYYEKYIISKKMFLSNNYIFTHPYYYISGILSLHPNYILDVLNLNKSVSFDINFIIKLDKYLKQNNIRNYNYDHIQKLL